jgi:hypothetical protein
MGEPCKAPKIPQWKKCGLRGPRNGENIEVKHRFIGLVEMESPEPDDFRGAWIFIRKQRPSRPVPAALRVSQWRRLNFRGIRDGGETESAEELGREFDRLVSEANAWAAIWMDDKTFAAYLSWFDFSSIEITDIFLAEISLLGLRIFLGECNGRGFVALTDNHGVVLGI